MTTFLVAVLTLPVLFLYSTWEEAEAGHAAMVKRVQEAGQ